jgi:predicted MFS family arabinose efflux permease
LIKFVSLFDEFHYLLMSASTVLLFAWFMTPYFYLVDHMTASGYEEHEASLVLSAIGVANTLGMVSYALQDLPSKAVRFFSVGPATKPGPTLPKRTESA